MSLPDLEQAVRDLCFRPAAGTLPGVDDPHQGVYRDLVRRSLYSNIRRTIPVARALVGDETIDALIAACLDEAPPTERFFRDVPRGFAQWAQTQSAEAPDRFVHPGLPELLHWEILEVDVLLAPDPDQILDPDDRPVQLHPSARLAVYAHPVHKLTKSSSWPPEPLAVPVCLLAFRVGERMEVVPLSAKIAQLLALLSDSADFDAALELCAQSLPAPLDRGYAASQLRDLHRRGALTRFSAD